MIQHDTKMSLHFKSSSNDELTVLRCGFPQKTRMIVFICFSDKYVRTRCVLIPTIFNGRAKGSLRHDTKKASEARTGLLLLL